MRGLARGAAAAAGALIAAACARQGFPPGGPPRFVPPQILLISPESGAVNVKDDRVRIDFDEVVAEKPPSAQSIADLVLISPRDGLPRIGWHRTHIDIRGQKPWRPNTAYTVTLRAGMVDLHGNLLKRNTVIVFSTGPQIPATMINGVVFDWATGKPVVNPLVQVFLPPDSAQYVTIGDSSGRFHLGTLPPGAVNVRALWDANNNRALDPREAWDTATVVLRDSVTMELYVFVHDTLGPRIGQLDVKDSLTLHLTLDKPVDTAQRVDTANFVLRTLADSQVVPIRLVRGWAAFEKALADSIAHADSEAAKTDTAAARRLAAKNAPKPQPAVPFGVRPDTTPKVPPPVPTRASPLSEFAIVVTKPLVPGSWYRLEARHLRNLLGDTATSWRTVQMPKPPPPKPAPPPKPGAAPAAAKGDSTHPPAKADSARPPAKPPRP